MKPRAILDLMTEKNFCPLSNLDHPVWSVTWPLIVLAPLNTPPLSETSLLEFEGDLFSSQFHIYDSYFKHYMRGYVKYSTLITHSWTAHFFLMFGQLGAGTLIHRLRRRYLQ
jgi:hypothetical protein